MKPCIPRKVLLQMSCPIVYCETFINCLLSHRRSSMSPKARWFRQRRGSCRQWPGGRSKQKTQMTGSMNSCMSHPYHQQTFGVATLFGYNMMYLWVWVLSFEIHNFFLYSARIYEPLSFKEIICSLHKEDLSSKHEEESSRMTVWRYVVKKWLQRVCKEYLAIYERNCVSLKMITPMWVVLW